MAACVPRPFISILSVPKGKRILSRAILHLSPEQTSFTSRPSKPSLCSPSSRASTSSSMRRSSTSSTRQAASEKDDDFDF
ncbi:hypothetical protein JCM5296_006293 [Sporobolomyces johnsonii]